MARVTVEDCIDKVENRFELVLLASHRARMISSGTPIEVDRDNDKNPVVAFVRSPKRRYLRGTSRRNWFTPCRNTSKWMSRSPILCR